MSSAITGLGFVLSVNKASFKDIRIKAKCHAVFYGKNFYKLINLCIIHFVRFSEIQFLASANQTRTAHFL